MRVIRSRRELELKNGALPFRKSKTPPFERSKSRLPFLLTSSFSTKDIRISGRAVKKSVSRFTSIAISSGVGSKTSSFTKYRSCYFVPRVRRVRGSIEEVG